MASSAKRRAQVKGRREEGTYTGIPHAVTSTRKYASLDGWSVKLLLDIAAQYNGKNNGDLSAAYSVLQDRGWRSKGTLHKAKKMLLELGFIQETRMGGRHRCSLYAITWKPIDDCKGKLEVPPSIVASGLWRD